MHLTKLPSCAGSGQYALDMAVQSMVLAGIPVIVAAGNDDTDACSESPARSEPAMRHVSERCASLA